METRSGDPLCPTRFEEFIGQDSAKTLLELEVLAVRRGKHRLRHILLYGPPGTGKSTLAAVVANELGGIPVVESQGADFDTLDEVLNTYLTIPEDPRGSIWLIDEIDGMKSRASQVLHKLMTHGYMTNREGARIGRHPVCVFGTTNYLALVPSPMQSRFTHAIYTEFYSEAELAIIAEASARRMGYGLAEEAAKIIGEYAAGEPRRVNTVLLANAVNLIPDDRMTITTEDIRKVISLMQLQKKGLTRRQMEYLLYIAECPKLRAGLNSIAGALIDDPKTVEMRYEPYLKHLRFVRVESGGRQLTEKGANYLLSFAC